MKSIKKWQIYAIAAAFLLLMGVAIGYAWRRATYVIPSPVTTIVHEYITDTIKIPVVQVLTRVDSIAYPKIELKHDTVWIVKDYEAQHFYTRELGDTNIWVSIKDMVQENRITTKEFKYKWLKPTTIVTNTTTINEYNKTLYLGLAAPIKDLNNVYASVIWATPKYYLEANYSIKDKGFLIGAGLPIVKLKTTKK